MSQKNLYASLIGINSYPQNPLGGCVKDALGMDNFLRKLCLQQENQPAISSLVYHPSYFLACGEEDKVLVDHHAQENRDFDPSTIKNPTFQHLTTLAFDHLKQAKDGDICVFYFSGHGSTLVAPEEFKAHKSKLQNETIVCVDSRSGARDLIDKEIAFLLWDALQGKNVHCVVIMDCCFAGNNTRAIETDTQIRYRHAPDSNRKIPLQEYLGYDKGFYQKNFEGGVDIEIGRYVQLAASMDNQTAQETTSNGGLFTSQLLDVLQKGGSGRSYRDLMQTTRVSVRNRNPNQIPVEFAAYDGDLDQPFLGGDIIPYKPTFEVQYDKKFKKWVLHGGAMSSLVSTPDNPTMVKVVGTDKEFKIKEVFSDISYLDATSADLDSLKDGGYQAVVSKYATPLLEVCLSNGLQEEAQMLNTLKTAYGDGRKFPFISIFFEKEKQDAPYQIRLTDDNQYVLVRTGNTIPVFKREKEPISFLTNVDYVGKWLVACELKNIEPRLKSNDFIFRFEKIEGKSFDSENIESIPAELVDESGQLPESTDFRYIDGNQPAFRLSIEINPQSSLHSCYVGALYLESKYKIRTDLISKDGNHLVKGGSPIKLKFISGSREFTTLPLGIDDRYATYNINEISAYLKIVVSNRPLFLDYYAQPGLELDDKPNKNTRDLGFDRKNDDTPEQADWSVFTTRIRIIGDNKSSKVQDASITNFGAFEMETPSGFQALVYAATGDDIHNRIKEIRKNKSALSIEAISPPTEIFGTANTIDQPFSAGISGAANNTIQVLELRETEVGQGIVLPSGKKIKIKPKNKLRKHETIIPFGFDEESGLFFPIGYTDDNGDVLIDQLPPPSDGVIEKVKSVGGSIKLFFQKVVWSRITGIREYDCLTLHQRDERGNIREIAYRGSERTKGKAAEISQVLGNEQTLLVIHGIIGDTRGMVDAVFKSPTLSNTYTGVLSFDFENLSTEIEKVAQKLKDMLLTCGFGEEKRLTIVSHSMGGLVSRYMIEHLGGDRFVKQLIQCGTPNSGSEIADFRRKVTGWLAFGMNKVALFQPYMPIAAFLGRRLEKGLFRTLDQMDPDSEFMARLNAEGKTNPGVPYYLIGGDTSQIETNYPEDATLIKKILTFLITKGKYEFLDRAIFSNEPNDMAVKVERMKSLPWGGHQDVQIIKCDHLTYFSNKDSFHHIENLLG